MIPKMIALRCFIRLLIDYEVSDTVQMEKLGSHVHRQCIFFYWHNYNDELDGTMSIKVAMDKN